MHPSIFQCRRPAGLGLTLLLILAGTAAGLRGESAVAISSPFLPPGAAAPAATPNGGPIEYHGYMVTPDGGERFSIYSTSKKTATWVGLNDAGGPYLVRSHRLIGNTTDQITVDYQGSSLVLALKEAKTISVATPKLPTPVPFVSGATSAAAPAVAGNPPNLPAGASLDEWAAEVQRRRQLRQQQSNQPAAPVATPAARANPAPAAGQRR
jgi:hypothetical protein